jgi:hypothetical protein
MVCEPHLSVRMESNHRQPFHQNGTLPLSYAPWCDYLDDYHPGVIKLYSTSPYTNHKNPNVF